MQLEKKYLIVCNVNLGGCGAASGLYDTKDKAIEAWNRRYGDGMDKPENDIGIKTFADNYKYCRSCGSRMLGVVEFAAK